MPLFGAWLALGFRAAPPRRRIGWTLAFGLAAAACIAPVTLANRAASGEFVLVSTNGGLNLWKGNGPAANGTHVQLPPTIFDLGHYLDGTLPGARAAVEQDRALRRATRAQVLREPGRALALFGRKLLLALNARELGIRDQFDFVAARVPPLAFLLRFWMIAPLGIVGLVLGRGVAGRRFPLIALFAAQLATLVLVFVLGRFRLVMAACLILLAAERVTAYAARVRAWPPAGTRRALVPDVVLASAALAVVLLPVPGLPPVALAEQHRHVAMADLKAGRLEPAAAGLRAALAEDWALTMPFALAVTRLNLAQCLEMLGRRDEARAEYERVLLELQRPGLPAAPPGLSPAAVRRRLDGLAGE